MLCLCSNTLVAPFPLFCWIVILTSLPNSLLPVRTPSRRLQAWAGVNQAWRLLSWTLSRRYRTSWATRSSKAVLGALSHASRAFSHSRKLHAMVNIDVRANGREGACKRRDVWCLSVVTRLHPERALGDVASRITVRLGLGGARHGEDWIGPHRLHVAHAKPLVLFFSLFVLLTWSSNSKGAGSSCCVARRRRFAGLVSRARAAAATDGLVVRLLPALCFAKGSA